MEKQKPKHKRPSSNDAPTSTDHDEHGTPIKRTNGPGPKDAGKGAAGAAAIDRVEGRPERAESSSEPGESSADEEAHEAPK
jgi:hypothetical protein